MEIVGEAEDPWAPLKGTYGNLLFTSLSGTLGQEGRRRDPTCLFLFGFPGLRYGSGSRTAGFGAFAFEGLACGGDTYDTSDLHNYNNSIQRMSDRIFRQAHGSKPLAGPVVYPILGTFMLALRRICSISAALLTTHALRDDLLPAARPGQMGYRVVRKLLSGFFWDVAIGML